MKNALFLTGAAARISQEVALVDKLIELKNLELSSDKTMLAGFSSGALNIGAINACFRNNNPLSWDKYFKEEVLFKIKTKDVFVKNRFIPVDTSPLRNLLNNFLGQGNLKKIDDCTFDSFILAFSVWRLTTVWASNIYNRHSGINLTNLLMATSAIPLIFPDQSIEPTSKKARRFIRGRFVDGGTGGSFRRFEKHLKKYVRQNGEFENLYIVSPMREVSNEDFEELDKIIPSSQMFKLSSKDLGIMKVFLDMISQNGFDTFIKRFYKWSNRNKIASNIFICIPGMSDNYPLLNFDRQEKQYQSVCQWVDENPDKLAIPIDEYAKRFEEKPLLKITDKIRRNMRHRLRSIFNI
ncbi:MAG: patatin-like phospholipase family protein [Prolixibacteraceae bacterium]|nr:patatin-like phospholipase family protein [Prolixibacteraceae bacterium]